MSKSPLSVAQKESDNIKKEVEKLIKECNKSVKNTKLKDKEEKLKQLYLQCRQVKKRVSAHLKETENLDKKDEPKTVKNYENKKSFEVNRLGTFENQLAQVMPKLCPDDNEEEFIKKLSENGELSNEENGADQEDGEEEDEEEDEDEKSKTNLETIEEGEENASQTSNISETKEEKKDSEEIKPEEKDEKKLTKKELAKIKKEEEKKKKEEEKKRKEEEKKKKEEEKKKMKEEEKKNKSKGKDSKKAEEEAKMEKTKVEDVEDGKKKKEDDEESDEEEEDDEEIEEDIEGDDEDESDEEEEEEEDDDDVHKDKKEMKKEQPVVTAKPRKSLLQREEKVEEIASEVEESEEEEEEEEDEEEEEEEESEDEDAVKEEIVKKEKIESRESAPVVSADKHKKEEEEEDEDDDEDDEEEDDDDDEEEEEEEEDDDEEEEEEEDEDDKQEQSNTDLEVTQPTARFEVIDDFAGETEEDLSVKKGEIIRIIDTREDGWWKAVNEEGKEGLVPKTFLQMYNQYKDVQQVDEEEEKKEEEEEEKLEGEEVTDGKIPKSQRSGKELWGSLRKQVNETLVSDVLHAMGAGPSGFRMPTLSKYYNESEKFRMKNFLAPKLSSSNLSYRDLFMNPGTGQMRATTVKLERIITLSSCQQIPPPAAGITVQRRYVRMCLFDGVNVLSNIHTIRVSSEDKTNRNWNFNARITDVMNVEQHNEFFVRGNHVDGNIGVLFELCISCVKSKSEERGEFSCGWVHLPLFDKAGIPIANKNYDCYVHGGTPYERDVEVDPSISRRASSNALVSLISGNKQPRLLLRVSTPSREQKSQLDLLPETLVGDMCLLSFYTYYRQILADTLIIHRLDLESTEPIHSPFLNLFPEVGDQPDLMSLFRENWILKCKSLKRAEKRDSEAMKKVFQAVFMETVYPVLNMNNFHSYKLGNTEVEQKRRNAIEKAAQVRRERRSALAVLLASDIVFKPFEMSEVSFNIISPHSLSEKIVPVPVEA